MNFLQAKSTKSDVVLTHCRNRIAYNILRSLRKRGLKVAVGVDPDSGMSVYSRHKYRIFSHPSFSVNEKAFINRLYESLLVYNPSVYIPTDEDIYVVARNLDKFKNIPVHIPISNSNILDRLENKYNSISLANSLGIPTPMTIRPKNKNEIVHFIREHGEPILLKILYSSSSRGVFYIYKNTLSSTLDEIIKRERVSYGDFIIQQYQKGVGFGVSMLFNQGKLRAKFTHKRIREKAFTGGPSTLRVSTRFAILEEYAERLLSEVDFHGVAMVEFKHNDQTGESWFLEVNPRFWGSLGLAIQSGVDFPYLLYKMAVNGDISPQLDYKVGLTMKWIGGDILSIVDYFKRTHSMYAIKEIFRKVDGYDDLSWDDPLPFAAEIFLHLHKIIKLKLKNSVSSK